MRDGTYVIGRATGSATPRRGFLALDHPTVSQRHAEVIVMGSQYYLTDLGSQNGTWRRRGGRHERISADYVDPGEPLMLGQCEIRLEELLPAG